MRRFRQPFAVIWLVLFVGTAFAYKVYDGLGDAWPVMLGVLSALSVSVTARAVVGKGLVGAVWLTAV